MLRVALHTQFTEHVFFQLRFIGCSIFIPGGEKPLPRTGLTKGEEKCLH